MSGLNMTLYEVFLRRVLANSDLPVHSCLPDTAPEDIQTLLHLLRMLCPLLHTARNRQLYDLEFDAVLPVEAPVFI